MFEKITKTLSGLAFIKYINSLIDYVNTSDIDATRIKGQLDISNIPPAGLDNVIKVDTVTDILALTVDDVQNGDTVMIIGVTPPVQYQVVDDTKLGTMDAFQEYAAGTATKALADINGNNIHTTYGKLAGNNTWTGNNYWNGSAIFNANLTIRGSATTPGDVSTYLWLGTQPEGSKQTPSIARNKQGDLVMYAADYRPCYLRSGVQTSFASVYNSDGTVEFSSLNNSPWGKYTNANGLELTVIKTATVDNDVPNKKYVDDSVADAVANGDVNSAKYLNITNFIPSNSDFNDYKTPGEYQVQSNIEAETIANVPTSYNDATPRSGVLSVLIGFNAPRTSLIQIYRTYGSSYVTSKTYWRCFYHENSSWTAWREIACTDEVGLLNQANTFTALNAFRANIAVSNGTKAGSSGSISLGISPADETIQARIGTDELGGLSYHASTNQPHVFRIGTNNDVLSICDDTSKMTLISNNKAFATVTHEGVAKWLGNANTATKLETARTINGVSFDGTANITIADSTKLPIAGGTMTGDLTLKGNPTADLMAATKKYVDDSVADAVAIGTSAATAAAAAQNRADEAYDLADAARTDLTEKITTVANNLATHEADFNNPHKVTAKQLGLTTVYQYKGSVATYADLPTTGQKVGDVWNVETADPDHGIKAGDNVAWDGAQWDILGGNHDLSGYAQLNSANTFTALNAFRANIAVSNGTKAGSSGSISLGISPADETIQARIGTDELGGLSYHASTNQPHVFRIGTNNDVLSICDDTSKMTLISNNKAFATVTHEGVAKWLGNANTATKLETARTINGVSFDGTANITIADSTKLPIAGGTMTGDLTLKGNPTADLMAATKKYVDDSVASAGGGDVLAAGNNSFTGANTFQNLVTMVGGVVFTSGTTTLAWKNATQIIATINASTYTGNSATATKLATARTITANLASSTAGSFDGSANITVGVTGTLPIANGGTGATTAAAARTALGCAPAYTYSTTDLTAGSSALTTGTLCIVYE